MVLCSDSPNLSASDPAFPIPTSSQPTSINFDVNVISCMNMLSKNNKTQREMADLLWYPVGSGLSPGSGAWCYTLLCSFLRSFGVFFFKSLQHFVPFH